MPLDDGFRQGKTDSDTVRIDLFVDTIETFENIFQFRLRDAAALILHINARVHRIVFRPDMDRRLLAGIVRCIFQQIDDCFGQPVSIADKHLFLVDLHINLLPAFLRQICDALLRLLPQSHTDCTDASQTGWRPPRYAQVSTWTAPSIPYG